MGEKRGMKALEVWCRRITDGYKDVSIDNMSSSWRDGLAFCALIHHFHPELIEFETLNKENVLQNNQLAFSVAEKHLGIPALLEAEDMVLYKVPDKLSIMTYVSQFYQCFQGSGRTISPSSPSKRSLENSDTSTTPSPDSPPSKLYQPQPSSLPRRYDVCQTCQQRVYILERLIIDSKLYHRTCFKCCRCQSVLKPGEYVDGSLPGQYECASCPDEEEAEKAAITSMAANRVARLTSPTDTWQPLRIRQSVEIRDLKLSSSVAEARMKFMSGSISPDVNNLKMNNSYNTKDNETKSQANLAGGEKKSEDKVSVDKQEKPVDLTSALDDLPPLAPASLALPEEAAIPIPIPIPIPSPRLRRKSSSTSEQDSENVKESESDEIFLTPTSSPLVSLRRDKAIEVRIEKNGVKTKPLFAVRQSKPLEAEAGTDGLAPSRTGMVIFDMPVIPSPVVTKPTSPPILQSPVKSRTTEDVASPHGSPQAPPKPKRLSAAVGSSGVAVCDPVVPAPRKRTSKLAESTKLQEVTDVPDDKKDTSPKKVPPPRPELPVFLKALTTLKSTLPRVKVEEEYPVDLNPFNDEGNDVARSEDASFKSCEDQKSLNPFDSDEENEQMPAVEAPTPVENVTQFEAPAVEVPSPVENVSRLEAPVGSNPFDSDEDDEDESNVYLDSSVNDDKPTPLPRKSLDSRSTNVSPAGSTGRNAGQKYRGSYSADTSPAGSIGRASGSKYLFSSPKSTNSDTVGRRTSRDSGLDISPTGSLSRGMRKKRPAPLPPGPPYVSSPIISHKPSPRSTKKSPAPPPPPPLQPNRTSLVSPSLNAEINEKTLKELDNLTLKSSGPDTAGNDGLSSPSPCQVSTKVPLSTFGYWKKKKPAPPVPIPPKRQITQLPMEEILKELKSIEEKQLDMEKKGVELEKAIREENLQGHEDLVDGEESELVLQLFELVNQKNTLFRRQVELVYLRRQQRLEEEHAELEFQIRCLMGKPETIKTDEDRELEEELIVRLVEVVRQRSEVIESIETDRLREAVEDQSIQNQMTLRQATSSRSLLSSSSSNSVESHVKKEKKKKKEKSKKVKGKEKCKDVDEDKDLDETETDGIKEKTKKEKKRKWF